MRFLWVFSSLLVLTGCGASGGSGNASVSDDVQNENGTAQEQGSAENGSQQNGSQENEPPENAANPVPATANNSACFDDFAEQMLNAINEARSEARQCGASFMPAVAPLSWNCTLQVAAQGHSDDMAQNNFHDHTGSDGLRSAQRVTNAGYQWRTVAENIAGGYPSIDTVMNGWLTSPGHCSNIMGAAFTEVGAALADNPQSDFRRYWTQNFATPRNF